MKYEDIVHALKWTQESKPKSSIKRKIQHYYQPRGVN